MKKQKGIQLEFVKDGIKKDIDVIHLDMNGEYLCSFFGKAEYSTDEWERKWNMVNITYGDKRIATIWNVVSLTEQPAKPQEATK
jgi:hypothetical protein